MKICDVTKRLLWSRSGGYCQNPQCHRDFFVFLRNDKVSNIEELAHVIGQSKNGPRGKGDLSSAERNEYGNIILLCPTCHSIIDKNPQQFPVEMLRKWKRRHEEAIRHLFVVSVYKDRQALGKVITQLLRTNRTIYKQYGPHSSHAMDPLADAAKIWRRYVLSELVPNNRQIANLLRTNEHLLREDEKDVFGAFVLHQQAFEYNHISGDKSSSAPLFPEAMNTILGG